MQNRHASFPILPYMPLARRPGVVLVVWANWAIVKPSFQGINHVNVSWTAKFL